MSLQFNKVILGGNLTRDPETRFLDSGMAVVKTGLAYNEKFKDRNGEKRESTMFVDLTLWGKRGEAFAKFHKKGSPALVEGTLKLDSWEDKDTGAKRYKHYVNVDSWSFAGDGKRDDASGGQSARRQPAEVISEGTFSSDDTPF